MSDIPSFAKLVPGFDFLQDLVKNAGAALPGMGQWVAPTLDPVELQKRIDELKTVQFWLEQNARMLGTTIQALEVQRMTLSTLKTMNVQMTDLRDALKVPPQPVPVPQPVPEPDADPRPAPAGAPAEASAPGPAAAPVDPVQWWGALTQQFGQLAAAALGEAADAGKSAVAAAAQATAPAPRATASKTARSTAPKDAAAKPAAKKPRAR